MHYSSAVKQTHLDHFGLGLYLHCNITRVNEKIVGQKKVVDWPYEDLQIYRDKHLRNENRRHV